MTRRIKMMEQLPVGMILTTADGDVLEINQEAVELLGFADRKAVLALNIQSLYADAKQRERMNVLLLENKTVRESIDLKVGGGKTQTFETRSVLFANHDVDLFLMAIWQE